MAHVLFLTHWYPSSRNPIEGIFIQEHARAVSSRHKVTVLHVFGLDQDTTSQIQKEIDPEHNLTVYHVSYPKPTLPKTAWLKRLQSVERLYNQISSGPQPPVLIHAHVYSSADLAVYLGRKYHLPIALSEHSSSYARNLFTPVQARKARYFLNRINLLLPVCEVLRSHMQRFGVRGPFEIVPNTVDVRLFHPAPDRPKKRPGDCRILQVASLNENKAVNDLIQAAAILKVQFPDLQVTLIGEGPERAGLENLARHLGLAEQVRFTGLQTKAQVAGWMQASDCLALTSHWENQPVAVLEALASGLPVAATNVGGLPEIITAQNGLLVPPGTPIRLAEAISQVIKSPELYPTQQISQYAAQQYSYPAVATRLEACYQRILGAGQP